MFNFVLIIVFQISGMITLNNNRATEVARLDIRFGRGWWRRSGVHCGRTTAFVRFALQRERRYPAVERVPVLALHAERAPHVATGGAQTDVTRVLERRQPGTKNGLLAHHSAASDRLQGAGQREDAPVPLTQLHAQLAQVLQADAVAPLEKAMTGLKVRRRG